VINFNQAYFLIQRDFIIKYNPIAAIHLENRYCNIIERPANTYNRRKLWKNAALQDKTAINTIMEYERTNGKTN